VARGNHVTHTLCNLLQEKLVSKTPRLLLDVAGSPRRGENAYRKIETPGEIAHKRFVGIGFRTAQSMVDVQDGGGLTKLAQGMEQKYGVGAPGYRYANAVSCLCHAITFHRRSGPLDHVLIVPYV
jgi:hypothetical protein